MPIRALWGSASPFFGLAIADVLLQRVDILLLSIVGGETVTGIYSAAYNLVRVLVKLVQSFWQAVYPTLSRLQAEVSERYGELSSLSLRYGLLLLLPTAALCTGVADELIHALYAEEYAAAGPVLQRLVWVAPIFFVQMYAVTALMVERRPQLSLAIMGLNLGALVVLLPPLARLGGAAGAAWAAPVAAGIGAVAGAVILGAQDRRSALCRQMASLSASLSWRRQPGGCSAGCCPAGGACACWRARRQPWRWSGSAAR